MQTVEIICGILSAGTYECVHVSVCELAVLLGATVPPVDIQIFFITKKFRISIIRVSLHANYN